MGYSDTTSGSLRNHKSDRFSSSVNTGGTGMEAFRLLIRDLPSARGEEMTTGRQRWGTIWRNVAK